MRDISREQSEDPQFSYYCPPINNNNNIDNSDQSINQSMALIVVRSERYNLVLNWKSEKLCGSRFKCNPIPFNFFGDSFGCAL